VGHAAYPRVTRDRTPASLSQKWIRDILQRKIGYRGLVVSDDLEMGGVLRAAPIEQAAVAHIRAGGDLCLVCHVEGHVVRCHEELLLASERDPAFARRCRQAIERVLSFKQKARELKRRTRAPKPAKLEKLTRRLWELGEQVRLEKLSADTRRETA